MATDIDVLVIENFVLLKDEQPAMPRARGRRVRRAVRARTERQFQPWP